MSIWWHCSRYCHYLGHFIRINFNPNRGDRVFTDHTSWYLLALALDAYQTGFKIKVIKAVKLVPLDVHLTGFIIDPWQAQRSVTIRIVRLVSLMKPWQSHELPPALTKRHHLGLQMISHWSRCSQFMTHIGDKGRRSRSSLSCSVVSCRSATRPEWNLTRDESKRTRA